MNEDWPLFVRSVNTDDLAEPVPLPVAPVGDVENRPRLGTDAGACFRHQSGPTRSLTAPIWATPSSGSVSG